MSSSDLGGIPQPPPPPPPPRQQPPPLDSVVPPPPPAHRPSFSANASTTSAPSEPGPPSDRDDGRDTISTLPPFPSTTSSTLPSGTAPRSSVSSVAPPPLMSKTRDDGLPAPPPPRLQSKTLTPSTSGTTPTTPGRRSVYGSGSATLPADAAASLAQANAAAAQTPNNVSLPDNSNHNASRESFSLSMGAGSPAPAASNRRVCSYPGCRSFCQPPIGAAGRRAMALAAENTAIAVAAAASMDRDGDRASVSLGSPVPGGAETPNGRRPSTSSRSMSISVSRNSVNGGGVPVVPDINPATEHAPRRSLFSFSPSPLLSPGSITPGVSGGAAPATVAPAAAAGPTMPFCYRHASRAEFPDVAPQCPKQWAAAMEIITSEASYQASLDLIVNGYMDRIDAAAKVNMPIISADEGRTVFHNMRSIAGISRELLADLQELRALRNERAVLEYVPLVLLHYSTWLGAYRSYLENYDAASSMVKELRETNQRFSSLLQINGHMHGLPLESLLIMPVQRLPRYTLLLKELQRHTSKDDPAYEAITVAEETMRGITSSFNAQMQEMERRAEVWALQTRIEQDDRYVDLTRPGRRIVREGVLKKRYSTGSFQFSKDTEYFFVLFNDLLMYASEKGSGKKSILRIKHVLQLRGMVVAQDTLKGRNDLLIRSENSSGKSKELVLVCPSAEAREAWFTDIQTMVCACDDGDGPNADVMRQSSKLASLL